MVGIDWLCSYLFIVNGKDLEVCPIHFHLTYFPQHTIEHSHLAFYILLSRLNTVMNAARACRRVEVKDRDALRPIICLVTITFVLLLCWTSIDPLQWQREPISENDPSRTYGFCKSEGWASVVFIVLLILLDLLAMVLLCVQAYRARKMDDELTESRWLVSVILHFQSPHIE